MVICINWREVSLLSTAEAKWAIALSVSCGIVAGFTIGRMTGRGRGSKIGGRRGRWSNDGRYWMENSGSGSGGQTNQATYNVPGTVYPPGVNQHHYGVPYQQPIATLAAAPVQPVQHAQPVQQPLHPVQPAQLPMAQHGPIPQPWGIQPWQMPRQWPINGQWGAPPSASMPPPVNPPPVNQTAAHQVVSSGSTNAPSGNARKDPAANEFPGPGNRAYFTKEYMDILEDIKMNKAVEEAKKRLSGNRRTSVCIADSLDAGSRSDVRSAEESKSADKTAEMKVWVMTTFGSSPKLITEKLQEVDQKVKVSVVDKTELAKLREEKAALEKVLVGKETTENGGRELSSSEKRKRAVERTPIGNSPRIDRVSLRGSKTKPRTKRINVSSDDESDKAGTVKQKLQPKMETSSELADIKTMLTALLNGLADAKGKTPIIEHAPASAPGDKVPSEDENEDLVQNATNKEDEEESDEGGLAAYMKMTQEFYSSLHYTRVQDLCKHKGIPYFKKDLGAWELAKIDLREYTDMLKGERLDNAPEPSSRKTEARSAGGRSPLCLTIQLRETDRREYSIEATSM
ncbi:hypothetical protein CBR_g31922 [Chara braunii]|uniref:Uncharacterized protein n=1 Tax=Chara braunii TaxID=69332 RepID=A0A388LG00_CHABU|nr:hypothetical protein CBR_g31922 [Chara braunii]|eukprot:GBG81250.1 hypothetical protein CBR_g31922 [Chara braunii]